mgnify:FL=1|jgi:hypothetical protein
MIMNQFDFSTSEDIMSYYYNVNTDTFHSKIEWLDQNALIDRIIVDKSATAQQVDKFFEIVYPHLNTDLDALLAEIS